MPPAAAAKAAHACMIPVATYGAEVWYEGTTKPIPYTTRTVVPRHSYHMATIDRALRTAARAVIPVWRTTPIPVLHRETGIPPASVLLQQIQRRASLRLRLLDKAHPLVGRTMIIRGRWGSAPKTLNLKPKVTRLQRMAQLEEECERPQLLQQSYTNTPQRTMQGKERGAKEFIESLKQDPPGTIHIYSDGSSMDSKTAWAFVAYRHGARIHTQSGSLNKAEVFDAEIRGAAEGLAWAAANAEALQATKVTLCIDNTSVIQGIDGHTPASSQSQFMRLKSMRQELRIPVETRWCPGHMGITGNEEADQLAKAAIGLQNDEQGPATVSWARRRNREERSRVYEA